MVLFRHIVRLFFFFQAEDGIRDLVRSRGLGDVYKRQDEVGLSSPYRRAISAGEADLKAIAERLEIPAVHSCLFYTSDAADERSSVDLGGRRIIKKKIHTSAQMGPNSNTNERSPHDKQH